MPKRRSWAPQEGAQGNVSALTVIRGSEGGLWRETKGVRPGQREKSEMQASRVPVQRTASTAPPT